MKKKAISVILLIILLISAATVAFAENENQEESPVPEVKEVFSADSPYAILVDMKTGMVLYEKNSAQRVYPADLTKIMTAVLVLENCKLEELVSVSESAILNVSTGDSKLGIIKEEKLSVRQLLYAMLLGSAADATNALAENTSGSMDSFVSLMNEKAKELNMENTHFTNPTGSHDERHYTTAEDMAKLASYAMGIPEFCEIVKCDSYSIPATEKCATARKVVNRNHFVSSLLRNDYYYKYSTGIKTGYSVEAKSCIAASATKGDISLIALVFGAETVDNVAQSFKDCKNLFDAAFSTYSNQIVVEENEIIAQTEVTNTRRSSKLLLKTDKAVSVLKTKESEDLDITYKDDYPAKISAPVKKGQIIGTREYLLDGKVIGKVNLISDKDYALDPISYVFNKIMAFIKSPWLFVCIFLLIFVFIMLERRRRRILRKKRRAQREKRRKMMEEEFKRI